jgi:signal transduction histidine kinase
MYRARRFSRDNKQMRLRKRAVLRNGFAVIIALLALSMVLAYSILEGFWRRSVGIHREFAHSQEVLTNLRRVLWLTGIEARDYFLNESPDRAALYDQQLEKLRSETLTLLPELKRTGAHEQTVQELESLFHDLLTTLGATGAARLDAKNPYEFIQREVVPRRDAAGQLLRELERTNRDSAAESEKRFISTRTAATGSLLFLLGACLVAGIMVAVASLRYSNHLERQATERFIEVSEAKQQLEQLSARLMEIQEEERTRLSRELHDEVVQNLAVLKMEINRAATTVPQDMTDVKRNLAQAKVLADSTMRCVRDISMLLRPSLLDDLGLAPALQALAEDFTRRTGTRCDLDDRGLTNAVASSVGTCAYRVVQEALRNCEKHSGASLVNIYVIQSDRQLSVEISDNGVGYLPSDLRSSPFHLGVVGMRERAAALGGTLITESAPGKGTVVRLEVPLDGGISESIHTIEAHA